MREHVERPSRISEWILEKLLQFEERPTVLGDFAEIYNDLAQESGLAKAKFWYWSQTVKSIPMFIRHSFYGRLTMFKNYLKVLFRNLRRYKGFSFTNIVGLAIGLVCCMFILLWVQDELSFDKFHEHADSLYLAGTRTQYANETNIESGSPPALGPALKEEYPEILNAARLQTGGMSMVFNYGHKKFFENVRVVDPSFLEMFTFPLIKGNLATALADPYNIVMTERIATKYFGNADPIGEIIKVNNEFDFIVTGVLKNIPDNSLIKFDSLVSLEFLKQKSRKGYLDTWHNYSFLTFIQLREKISAQDVEAKIAGRIKKGDPTSHAEPFLCLYTSLYLYGLGSGGGNITQVRIFCVIAFFILLIACINFMNLTTARSGSRAKEIGMRKVTGANRGQIIKQYYVESILISFISLFVAMCCIRLLLPTFNRLVGKQLTLSLSDNPSFFLGMIAVALFTGIVAGSYPALFMSAFQPIKILKGDVSLGPKKSKFRKVLVVTQFTISVALIIGTMVIYKQVHYLRDKELGLNKENLVYIPLYGELKQHFEAVKRELLNHPDILHVSLTSHSPTGIYWDGHNWDWEGKDSEMNPWVTYFSTDTDFLETFETKMAEGTFYKKEFTSGTSESMEKIVINERFARIMGMDNPVGARLSHESHFYTVIGVIKDFNTEPLYREIEPMVVFFRPERFNYVFIRIRPENIQRTIGFIEDVNGKFNPEFPFTYSFLEDDYTQLYSSEMKLGSIVNSFAALAILISCIGLFGLVSFLVEQRTKEIGIRKVLGSSVLEIVLLLSRDFIKCLGYATLIAWPVGYLVMNNWLHNFAYQTKIGLDIFIFSAALVLVIALLTVSFQSIKAATANPVDALRYE